MNVDEKPVYKLYIVGYPGAVVQYYPIAARELGVNLEVEYHGCVIQTLYSDDYGLVITDAAVESLRVDEENRMAVAFYKAELGSNWFVKVRTRAFELLEENEWKNDLPF